MFNIVARETGTFICQEKTLKQAEQTLYDFIEQDKKDGVYEEDFYEIVEVEDN